MSSVISATTKNPETTWVVTLRTNGMAYPNWDGISASAVLTEAQAYLKQPITNLSAQLQKDWS